MRDVARNHSQHHLRVRRSLRRPQAKRRIKAGADANFTLADLGESRVLEFGDLFYPHGHSPHIGVQMRGRVARTLVHGITVFDNGGIVSGPVGRLVRPEKTG